MRYLRLLSYFARASFQEEAAYQSNFYIGWLHSLLNLATGVLGVMVLFGQIETVNGWNRAATLALLGVYLTVSALRSLFLGPSLEALAGMDGEVWTGQGGKGGRTAFEPRVPVVFLVLAAAEARNGLQDPVGLDQVGETLRRGGNIHGPQPMKPVPGFPRYSECAGRVGGKGVLRRRPGTVEWVGHFHRAHPWHRSVGPRQPAIPVE